MSSTSFSSSSTAPPRRGREHQSCALCVPNAVGLVVVVVEMAVVGRIGCLSLLLTKTVSMESHSSHLAPWRTKSLPL